MATTVHRYVDPDASGGTYNGLAWATAYQTLFAAEANNRDCVANDEVWIIHCRSSSATVDSTLVYWKGWTTDATRYVEIICDDDDTYGHNRHAGKWDTTKYILQVSNACCLQIEDEFIRLTGVQIETVTPGANGKSCVNYTGVTNDNDIRFKKCIFKGHAHATYTQNLVGALTGTRFGLTLINCVFWNLAAITGNNALYGFMSDTADSYIYNCTFSGGQYGVRSVSGHTYAKNVIATGTSDADFYQGGTGVLHCNYCASEDATADDRDADGVSGNNHINHTFTFVDAASGDFHLGSTDTGAIDLGTDLSAATPAVTDDIDGVARSGTWDIGADEYASGATSVDVSADLEAARGVLNAPALVMSTGKNVAGGLVGGRALLGELAYAGQPSISWIPHVSKVMVFE
jgi:hypothetical protein